MSIINVINESLKGDTIKYVPELETRAQEIKVLVQSYIQGETELNISDVGAIINVLQVVYNDTDVEVISDSLYDELYSKYNNLTGSDIVGSSYHNESKRYYPHTYQSLRGTLDKVHFVTDVDRNGDDKKSLEQWVGSVERSLGRPLFGNELGVTLFAKWDGVSAIFEATDNNDVSIVLKRGDTKNNEATSIKVFNGVPMPTVQPTVGERYGVKTEIVMSEENFKKFCDKEGEKKSPRSAVTSIVNSDDATAKDLEYLTVIPLQISDKLGNVSARVKGSLNEEYAVELVDIKDTESVHNAIHQIQLKAAEAGLPIDGVVLRLNDESLHPKLGRLENINKFEVAYKIPLSHTPTQVIDVEFSIGLMGSITPVLKLEPVKISGNTVKSCSLGSMDIYRSLNLSKGDIVELSYNIIPHVERVVHTNMGEKLPQTITNCPICTEPLEVVKNSIMCINPMCEAVAVGSITRYAEKMGIESVSYTKLNDLFRIGHISNISDLYKLDDIRTELEGLSGWGKTSVDNLINSVKERSNVESHRFLGSLGIRSSGRTVFKKITEVIPYKLIMELIDNDPEKLKSNISKIMGIGEIMTHDIVDGLSKMRGMIKEIEKYVTVKDAQPTTTEYLFSVCFSGVRDKEFEKYLDANNVKVVSSYRKTINYLIVANTATSTSKTEKAKADGVDIISIEDMKIKTKFN